jgi:Cold shock proteins
MKGTIKDFFTGKNFGFIYSGGNEIFYHISDFVDESIIPEEGMSVSFELKETAKGKQAFKIVRNAKVGAFIEFGDELIRISNIKYVKIVNESSSYINSIKGMDDRISNLEKTIERDEINGKVNNAAKASLDDFISYRDDSLKGSIKYQLALKGELEYLYVMTYQKEEHKFYHHIYGFDLQEKFQEIKNYSQD